MKLKSIRAFGFKSFADKIDIELKTNITAIVGPNGSGKSNIVDAVRWVLGEQSVKSLRGAGAMSDVIFAGSETRSPLKRCEVALTFDNTDHFLNTDLQDVEVKRVLYHTGENEYYINNSKVRLKDVTNLFLDSGVGVDSFNIISQGSIESIVSSKPYDRRVILEGAAGVLKYKTRKTESVRKLEKTKDNLEKVTLVTDELALSVEPLKEQSIKAKKYLELKKDLEGLEISLTTYDINQIHEVYNVLAKEMEELQSEKEKLEVTSTKDNNETESLKLKLLHLEEDIDKKNKELISINENLAKISSEYTLLLERQKYEVSEEKVNENLLALKEEEVRLSKELSLLQEDITKLETNLNHSRRDLSDLEEKDSLQTLSERHLNNEYEECSRNNLILKNKINLLEANIEQDMSLPVAVKNVINHPRLRGIHKTIGKNLNVKEELTTAIDIALGASSNFIICDNEACAKEAINYLKNNHLGRATFFPLNVIKGRMISKEDLEIAKKTPGFLGVASDLVSYDELYHNIMTNQLGNVLVARDFEAMNHLASSINYRYRVVTLDGEIMHSGGSLTGGSIKKQTSSLTEKKDLVNAQNALKENEITLKNILSKKTELQQESEERKEKISKLEKDIFYQVELLKNKNKDKEEYESKLTSLKEDMSSASMLKNGTVASSIVSILDKKKNVEIEKEKITRDLTDLQKEKSELSSSISELENKYREKNSNFHKIENEINKHEIEIGKLDTKMDYLLNILSEDYHITYEKAKMDYELDIKEDIARLKVKSLKNEIRALGDVNIGSISEYERVNERYEFLMTQKEDLEKSCEDLYKIIDEMDGVMETRLKEAFQKIAEEFSIIFKKMFKGGRGELRLTEPENILETGIEIVAEPPGKKLNSIQLLSGGEKTLTAISLLFAILNVYPVPFCILDEVEAALDEANVDTFGKYLQEQKDKSEFLLITHKKRTMEYAGTLYGITMQEQGVSKIVSVTLENKDM